MSFAWYVHLKNLSQKPWLIAALLSWGVALFEYLFQVPANRLGFSLLLPDQLKILQEMITLTVFVPFAIFYMQQLLKLDFLWAMPDGRGLFYVQGIADKLCTMACRVETHAVRSSPGNMTIPGRSIILQTATGHYCRTLNRTAYFK